MYYMTLLLLAYLPADLPSYTSVWHPLLSPPQLSEYMQARLKGSDSQLALRLRLQYYCNHELRALVRSTHSADAAANLQDHCHQSRSQNYDHLLSVVGQCEAALEAWWCVGLWGSSEVHQ